MFKTKPGLVNGEIVKDLLDLCNEQFVNPFIQNYAGSNYECMYCGATQNREGGAHHSAADCPAMKYQDLAEKHKRFIERI